MNRIRFQLQTVYKNKFNFIPLVLLLLIITAFLYLNAGAAGEYSIQSYLKNDIAIGKGMTSGDQASLKGQNASTQKDIQSANASNEQHLAQDQEILNAINRNDWGSAYPLLVVQTKTMEQVVKSSANLSGGQNGLSGLQQELLMYQALAERKVPYSDPGVPTFGVTFSQSMLQYVIPVMLSLTLIFILVSLYTEPFKEHIQRDLLLPRSKNNLLATSLGTGVLISFALFFVALLFAFVLSTISYGMGNWNYPIVSYRLSNHQMFFQSLYRIILPSLVLQSLAIIFVICTVYLIAYLLRDRLASMFISILVIVGVMLATNIIEPLQKVAQFLPTSYLNAVSVTTGEYANNTANFSTSFGQGVVVLITSIIILVAATIFVAKKVRKN